MLATNFHLTHGRGVVAGIQNYLTGQTINGVIDQIVEARNQGALGNIIYHYGGFSSTDLTTLKNLAYPQKAPIPDMPWLSNPTDAIIVDNVTGPNNEVLVDVQLRRNSSNYTWLSGSDGFYAMLKVPANQTITLSTHANTYGHPQRTISVPALQPGEVRRVNIQLGVSNVEDWALY